ncbi:prefoldin subunit beta [Candidatus Woesearchaeota archaeon]|nr:MAG: prefoldin subunit beta [Candidatus Woesearchaeota archaeon]
MDKETQQKIQQLQLIEQSLQNFLAQKQQFQAQLMEIESALSELDKVDQAYKIIGNIMVLSDAKKLKKDLEQKKETTELRIKTIERQENSTKEKAENLQKEVLEKIERKK